MSSNTATQKSVQTASAESNYQHKAKWDNGDYSVFSRFMDAGAIEILESWNITTDKKMLDVGCGTGQVAIASAKKGNAVTGVDISEHLIQYARKRALKDRLITSFDVGDAEDLPYKENAFDVVVSMFGAMYAQQPVIVSEELARIIKPGGKLYMANWTPDSMPAQVFKCALGFANPGPGFIPPSLWGDEATVISRLYDKFSSIKLIRRKYPQWHYPFTAYELVDFFRQYLGPIKSIFDVIDNQQQLALEERLEEIFLANSETHNNILSITGGEYLQVIATAK